jgi:hypothetical protein
VVEDQVENQVDSGGGGGGLHIISVLLIIGKQFWDLQGSTMYMGSSSSRKGENPICACRLAEQQPSPRGREVRAFVSFSSVNNSLSVLI